MSWKVLLSAPYMQPVVDRFRSVFAEHGIELIVPVVRERMSEEELLEYVGEIDGVICGDDRFTRNVLERSPKLKVISKWGTGLDSIDQEAAEELGIRVCNTPNAFTEPVADTTLGYLLCFSRRLPWMDRAMKTGTWEKIPGFSLGERTLGIIGVGNIGKAVAMRALAFGMRLLGHDPVEPAGAFLQSTGMEMVNKETLLREADFVSLHCDLNASSRYVMDEQAFDRMKSAAVLINTARGPLVDENALVAALQQGRLAGAAMDVFETEPLSNGNALLEMDNVLLAPHNSNSSPRAWERVHESTIGQLVKGLSEVSR